METLGALGGGPVPVGTMARAVGDSTTFGNENSTLAVTRAGLIDLGLLFAPAADLVAIGLAGYREHLNTSAAR